MNEEELKAGERYNFTLLYTGQSINNKFSFESPTGIHYILGLGDMEAVTPVSAPPKKKYDPCRLFRKGDKVRLIEWNGRKIEDHSKDNTWEVMIDETSSSQVSIKHKSYGRHIMQWVAPCFLELVTPVEELEPYKIAFDDVTQNWNVIKDGVVLCSFKAPRHPHAEKSAVAECKRLNEEYRKEQE